MSTDLVVRPDHMRRVRALAAAFVEGRRTDSTKRKYREHLASWLAWCVAENIDPLDARHAHVSLWLSALQEAGDADSTRAARLAAVGSWYRWMLREEVVSRNPATLRPEERPQPSPLHTPALSAQQAEALMQAADADDHRTSALIALMLFTGARIGELLGASVSDLAQESGHPVLRIMGKGRKRRNLALIPGVHNRLTRYLNGREAVSRLPALPGQVNRDVSVPLLATSTGGRMDLKQVRRILMRCARRAGLPLEVCAEIRPHSTRATYATANLSAGTPLRDVQYALGHADPRTTEGYDRSSLSPDRHPSFRLATLIHMDDISEQEEQP